ncbi:gliding motility-associated C-terminal domain-containing protein [Paracrocinitomix mangrovi]|uniref:T9SS type B sorting domain-containing protein n=1 Tax=Paracrocinitomix mangrovi TaxID=2862509 RepID=UPI001C8E23A6|nr:gliding motility-associated C-terminal domain-containing protein [Paracrocinitomix mangrovi]UKN00981.1 gliding motility-associated C-terminal domain-containing protein [Paracrocinitomix mangrovi]
MKQLGLLFVVIISTSCVKQSIKQNGCQDQAKQWTDGSCSYTIGNIFTPNGDGANDVFFVYSSCEITNYSMKVYKKDELIYSSNNPQMGWDGQSDGKNVKEGVYEYQTSGIINGTGFSESGEVTLIRDLSYPIDACLQCIPAQSIPDEPLSCN